MSNSESALLRRLERLRESHGAEADARKLELLAPLVRGRLSRASEVLRLHEILCFLSAYPDSPALLRKTGRMLAGFHRRADLLRHRDALADSGIAGTEIRFNFFARMAEWLARRWPDRIVVDWEKFSDAERLEPFLPLLVHFAETPGLDEWDFSLREWLDRLKGRRETEAAFLIRRLGALKADDLTRETLYDHLDIPMRLLPGRGTPSRTMARHIASPVVFVRRELSRQRPRLPEDALRRPRGVREAGLREARALIDLAREAMVTRQRDLDVFSYASPRDVRMVEWEEGLQFAVMGALPERRLLLESVYGFLTLKSGVPVGYVLASALFGSSEIAYNVFDTYRGAEAGPIYGRVMATIRHLFGSDAFTIFPYQLGHENEEAIQSGAWWFYQKVGFRPREREALRLMRRELARMKRNPAHRSSPETLRALARENLYYFMGKPRRDVIGGDFLPDIGLRITDSLARRFGSDREAAARACSREAAVLLGLRTMRRFSAGERLAWERWAPLIRILPGVARWSATEKRALLEVVRAKGGRRESEFVARFDRHPRLRRAILRLAGMRGE
jgi:hypothetical protein